ncbi:hypothetical protein BOTBODRAFT_178755 [Botryobasidium botryosum FD-172 SS1]|uniref:Uncharacterized protein n=1 Tax=Botryobasidium botryosum (strain FD-172 SS1) TaxID=930990 RepID=A0A067ME58_BOTB1|nr:hypothetical protein BOTBODRAFT_178755 [Botryobasidium botryosum FD-172 SS1]
MSFSFTLQQRAKPLLIITTLFQPWHTPFPPAHDRSRPHRLLLLELMMHDVTMLFPTCHLACSLAPLFPPLPRMLAALAASQPRPLPISAIVTILHSCLTATPAALPSRALTGLHTSLAVAHAPTTHNLCALHPHTSLALGLAPLDIARA